VDDELLRAYDRELSHLRRMGAEFARAHPKIAGRLRLGTEQIEDPHVSRLVESVAFLNARIRRKLDDEFPELTDGLLGVVAPHLLAPTPSMSIVQFTCAADLKVPTRVERGTGLVTDASYGEPCRYRTAYDTEVWPIAVDSVRLSGPPFTAPSTPRSAGSGGVIHIVLKPAHESGNLSVLAPKRLRFHLTGELRHMAPLYELLLNDALEIAIATSPNAKALHVLPASAILPVGFDERENVVPDDVRAHSEQRLLTEYFAFPQKFLFFDLEGLRTEGTSNVLHLFVYLRRTVAELESVVKAGTLRLGCTPIVNLFERKAEPIRLTGTQHEYQVIADARHQVETEIYSIDSVKATSRAKGALEYAPFHGLTHDLDTSGPERYWFASRRPTPRGDDEVDRGTEVHIALVDSAFGESAPDDWVLESNVTCLNRNQPARLPFGGGHPRMTFTKGGGAITAIACLYAPTHTLRPARGRGALWRLVSSMALHRMSLVDGRLALDVLREALRLCDPSAGAEGRRIADALLAVEARPAVRRVGFGGQSGFCRGLAVALKLDDERLRGNGSFLLATVLERYLASACALNSFVETSVTTTTREGVLRRWPPRNGTRLLL
jgi:type VI secretion system protein ImpG